MSRMMIHRYIPDVPADGLPTLPDLPPPDGSMSTKFIGKRISVDGWARDAMKSFAKSYARTCMAARDLEIDALKVERDALKTALDELKAAHG